MNSIFVEIFNSLLRNQYLIFLIVLIYIITTSLADYVHRKRMNKLKNKKDD